MRTTVTGLAAALALTFVGAAQASEKVTIGSKLNRSSKLVECDGGCAGVNEKLPSNATKAPFKGVIVRWRVKGVGTFRLFRAPYTRDADTLARGPASVRRTAKSASEVSVFNARLPIDAGDHLGLWLMKGAKVAWAEPVAGADFDAWIPVPPVGRPTRANASRDREGEMAFHAEIEPDRDGDGYGDGPSRQDKCPTDPKIQGECPPPPPPATPRDTTPPSFLSRTSIRPKRFRARRGGKLRFKLSEPALVGVVVERGAPGRFVDGRCRRPSRRSKKRDRRCVRYRSLGGTARRFDQGPNAIRIRSGMKLQVGSRVKRRRFSRGRYRATLAASDAAGNGTRRVRVGFRVR